MATRQPELSTGPYVPPVLGYVPAPQEYASAAVLGGTPEPSTWDLLPEAPAGVPVPPEAVPMQTALENLRFGRPVAQGAEAFRQAHPFWWVVLIPVMVVLLGLTVYAGLDSRLLGSVPVPPPPAAEQPVVVNPGPGQWFVSIAPPLDGWVGNGDEGSGVLQRYDRYADDGTWAGMVALSPVDLTQVGETVEQYATRTLQQDSGAPGSFGAPQQITAGGFAATLYTARTPDMEYWYVFIPDPDGRWLYVLSAQDDPHSAIVTSTTGEIKIMIDSFQKFQ